MSYEQGICIKCKKNKQTLRYKTKLGKYYKLICRTCSGHYKKFS